MKAGDWILVAMLSSLPLLGVVMGRGDGLSLAGVGILIWVGHRAPISSEMRRAHRALGISVVLVLLCLFLPKLDSSTNLAWLGTALRVLVIAVLVAALSRRNPAGQPHLRAIDRITAFSVLVSVGIGLAFISVSHAAALSIIERVCLMAAVYAIFRRHLLHSEALPVLTRATLAGVAGACLVAFSGPLV